MAEESKSRPTSETVTSPSSQPTDAQGQLTAAVDDLLDQLQHKFDNVSRDMFGKLDDMARRLDELEASLTIAGDTASPGAGSPKK
ncbi:heat shock factor-binding 1 family protein [Aspergillus candidus]|uniref:Heat shock factor binding protein 1-domain-containing protein n=1 Tax=Aspergillus candidus TaxID=41067 RepID=A0A2I2FBW9_ASPCN|nr:heat shock factor binding protein 1-domain-containing protein [Aspergillus candidus]PLB38126.1 heat shock factor binding protein 1-domain-containing protein [Aspergillus candidus]